MGFWVSDPAAHLTQDLELHECENRSHFVSVHARIQGIRNELGNQPIRVQPINNILKINKLQL